MNGNDFGRERTLDYPRNSGWLSNLLLPLCMVQFTSAWIYFGSDSGLADIANTLANSKKFGVPFQYSLWALITWAFLEDLYYSGFSTINRLKPFLPYGLICALAGIFGYSFSTSARHSVFWIITIFSAAIIAARTNPIKLTNQVLFVFVLLMAGSCIAAFALPDAATRLYGGKVVWSGLFSNKNQLGWIASLAFIVAFTLMPIARRSLAYFVLVSSGLCLIFSYSMGAIFSSGLAIAYLALLKFLRGKLSAGLGALTILVTATIVLLALILFAPAVAEMTGRDLTFTGRTTIWQVYFDSMLKSPILGEGPGAFTELSPHTLPLAYKLRSAGMILTPHNMFLGVFGDSGLIGLMAFVGLLLFFSIYIPFKSSSPFGAALGGVSTATMLLGMGETHDTFGAGPTWFLLAMLWTVWAGDSGSGKLGYTGYYR